MPVDVARMEEIFGEAVAIPAGPARVAYLDQACGGDAELRRRVEQLLAAHDASGNFLKLPEADGTTPLFVPLSEGPKSKIGRYKLLEQIGEGGFGVVFMAEQEEPVRRMVALKIIKLGMDTRQIVARFEAERQALAMMDHPNVAKVLDGGATETGRPYFVMELVKGVPITEFCDKNHLTISKRLDLFLQVCQAVQHAHQKGLIHRDIKPSNVLVSTQDDRPVAKVIDFGVAKAMQARLTEKTLFTEFQQLVGTPAYMSPEQADGSLDIDTRSDVYALGVLLYELLAGSTPFDPKELRSKAFAEMQRIICVVEPPMPSTRLSSLSRSGEPSRTPTGFLPLAGRVGEGESNSLASIAAQRSIEPRKLAAMVRGELDWIVMKALEKDRSRRYDTAGQFAADVLRHLSDEPVEACPPSSVYRFRKFARRNKSALIAGSVVVAALFLGLIATTWQAIRATHAERMTQVQRDRALEAEKVAKTEVAIATAVNDFLNDDLLSQADPLHEPDRDIKLRRVLDRAAKKIETRFSDQPLVEAAIRMTLGRTYVSLDEKVAAERQLNRALELYRRELGDEDSKSFDSAVVLARLYRNKGTDGNPQTLDEARKLFEQTLAGQRRVLGEEHPETLLSVFELATTLDYQERPAEGIALFERSLPFSLACRVWGDDDPRTLAWMNTQANMLRKVGRGDEALQIYQQALTTSRRVLGEEHPITLGLEDNLAISLRHASRFVEAIMHSIRVVDKARRVLGESHGKTGFYVCVMQDGIRGLGTAPHGTLGVASYVRGRPIDPGAPARVVGVIKQFVDETPHSGGAWTALGMSHYEAEDWTAAIGAWEKSMEVRQARSGIDWFLLSMAHWQLSDKKQARKFYDQGVEWTNQHRPGDQSCGRFRAEAAELLGITEPQPATAPALQP